MQCAELRAPSPRLIHTAMEPSMEPWSRGGARGSPYVLFSVALAVIDGLAVCAREMGGVDFARKPEFGVLTA